MLDPAAWHGDGSATVAAVQASRMLDVDSGRAFTPFPFVQKLLLPPGAVVAVFGDLHGSLHSFLRELNALVERGYLTDDFHVAPDWADTFFMLFLGDYVDRGAFGAEVIFTLLELKLKNPTNVVMSRGNHEDEEVNKPNFGGTFDRELKAKFGDVPEHRRQLVYRLYDMLPLAVYVGRVQPFGNASTPPKFIQACHGGIEAGWDPKPFLQQSPNDGTVRFAAVPSLARRSWLASLPPALRNAIPKQVKDQMKDVPAGAGYPSQPSGVYPFVGFVWSDFTVDDQHKTMDFSPGRGFVFGRPVTEAWLDAAGIVGFLRAHQHNNNPRAGPMMDHLRATGGLVNNWGHAGLVYTFLSGTECPGFNFHDDSFGLLTVSHGDAVEFGLHHCKHAVSPQAVKFNGHWQSPLTPKLPRSTWEAHVGKGLDPHIPHACPVEFHFQCKELPAPFPQRTPRNDNVV